MVRDMQQQKAVTKAKRRKDEKGGRRRILQMDFFKHSEAVQRCFIFIAATFRL